MSDNVAEIKNRLNIVDVVSSYVQLKKMGHNYKGLCPFHSEKTPSFVVSEDKQICHCFGCGKGGDIFSFVQEVEGVSFSEAMVVLADRAGIKLEKTAFSAKRKGEKDEYFRAHDLACEFFEEKLFHTNDGKKVLDYLHKRGVKDATIKEFRVGYSPDSYDELHTFLLNKGVSKKVLVKSGFVSSKGIADDKIYDKFRSRLMFPIFDYIGRICGFGGRALKDGQMPKYLNSPENIIYSKSKVLYGLFQAKPFIKSEDKVFFVEGYFDVILPFQEGIKNVVASSGTALSEDQVRIVKRLTGNVSTCFDSDKAGFEATKRAYSLFLRSGVSTKAIYLPEKDPADVVVNEGREELLKYFSSDKDFVLFYTDKLVSENDISSLDGRRVVLKVLLPMYKRISPSDRDVYVRHLANSLNVSERSLYDELNILQLPIDHPAKSDKKADLHVEKMGYMDILFSLILAYPSFFSHLVENDISEKYFTGLFKTIYKELLHQYNSARSKFKSWDESRFSEEVGKKAVVLKLYADDKYMDFAEDVMKNEFKTVYDKLVYDYKKALLTDLQKRIEDAEKVSDDEVLKSLLKDYQTLISQ